MKPPAPHKSDRAQPIVLSYGRFSTTDQKEGDSRRRQDELADRWVKARGWSIHSRFWDEGISAFHELNLTHGELGKLVRKAEAGDYPRGTYLVVEEFDRLSRAKTMAGLSLLWRILQNGIRLVTLDDEHEYSDDDDDPFFWLKIGMKSQTAHHESDKKRGRGTASWDGRRGRANCEPMTGVCPAWLSNVPRVNPEDKKRHIINPARANIVRRIFDEFIGGKGVYSIAAGLRSDGVEAWGKPKRRTADGSPPEKAPFWHKSYISKILQNPAVIGVTQPCRMMQNGSKKGTRVAVGEPIPNYYPRVISDEVWLKAVQRWKNIQNRGQKSPSGPRGAIVPSLFSGLLICGWTAGPTKVIRKSVDGPLRIYSEDGSRRLLGWDYDEFETAALGAILSTDDAQLWPNDDIAGEKEAVSARIAELTVAINTISASIENLLTTLEKLPPSAAEAVSQRLAARAAEKEAILVELRENQEKLDHLSNSARAAMDGIAAVRNLFGARRESPFRDVLRNHLRGLVDRIAVYFPLAYRQRELDVLEKAVRARKLLTLAQERRSARGLGMDDFKFRFRDEEHRKAIRLAEKIKNRHRHLVIYYKNGTTVSTKGRPQGLELEEAPGQVMVEGDGNVWSGFLDIARATKGHKPGRSPLHDPSLVPGGKSIATARKRLAKHRPSVATSRRTR